jgi:hypothetical protein
MDAVDGFLNVWPEEEVVKRGLELFAEGLLSLEGFVQKDGGELSIYKAAKDIIMASNQAAVMINSGKHLLIMDIFRRLDKVSPGLFIRHCARFHFDQDFRDYIMSQVSDPAEAEIRTEGDLKAKIKKVMEEKHIKKLAATKRYFSQNYPEIVLNFEGLLIRGKIKKDWVSFVASI